MLYFSIALLVAAILLALLHMRASRSGSVNTVAAVAIAVVVVVASAATTVQVYRIGDSGAQAASGDTAAATDQVDEQCCAATNQQLSHPRSQAAAAVEDTDHRPDGEQGQARQEDRGDQRRPARREHVRHYDHNRSRRERTETGQGGRPR